MPPDTSTSQQPSFTSSAPPTASLPLSSSPAADGSRTTRRRPAPARLTLAPPSTLGDPNSRSAPNSPVRSMTSIHTVAEPIHAEAKELSNTLRGTPRRRPSMPFKPNLSVIPPSAMASSSKAGYPSPLSSTQAALRSRPDAYRDPSEHILSGRGSTLQHARSVYAAGPIEILPGVWLGDEHNARDAETISDLGITTILNVAKETVLPFQTDPDSLPMRLSRQDAGPIVSASGRGGVPIPPAPSSLDAEPHSETFDRSDIGSPREGASSSAMSERNGSDLRMERAFRPPPKTPASALFTPADFYTPPTTATFARSSAARSPLIPGAYPPFTPLDSTAGSRLSLFVGLKRAAFGLGTKEADASVGQEAQRPGSAGSSGHPTFVRSTASTPNLKTAYKEGLQNIVSPMTLAHAHDSDAEAGGYSSGVSSSRPSTSTATTRSDDGASSSTSSPYSSSSSSSSHHSASKGDPSSAGSKSRPDTFSTPTRLGMAPETIPQQQAPDPILPPSLGSSVPLPPNAIALTIPASPLSGRLQPLRYIKLPWTHDEMSLAAPDGGFAQGCAIMAEALGIRAIEDEDGAESPLGAATAQEYDGRPNGSAPPPPPRRAPGGVLVHCQCGVSRSATLVIAFVMQAAALGYGFAETKDLTGMHDCYSFVKEKSSSISPNCSLIYQLVEWERHLSSEANRLRDYLEAQARASGIEQNLAADGVARSVPGAGARWAGEAMDEEEWTRMRREEEEKEAEEEARARKARLEEGVRLANEKKLARERESSAESSASAEGGEGAPLGASTTTGLGARRKKFTPSLSLGVQGNTAATNDALRQLGQAPLKTGRPTLSLGGRSTDAPAGGLRAKTPRSAKPAALLSSSLAKPLEGLTLEAGPIDGSSGAVAEGTEAQEILREQELEGEELALPNIAETTSGEETPVGRVGMRPGGAQGVLEIDTASSGSRLENVEGISPTTVTSHSDPAKTWDDRAPVMVRQGSAPLSSTTSSTLLQAERERDRTGSSGSVGSSASSSGGTVRSAACASSIPPSPSPLGPTERSASLGTLSLSSKAVSRSKSHRLSSPTSSASAAARRASHHLMQGITASFSSLQDYPAGWNGSEASSSASGTPQTARSPNGPFAFPASGSATFSSDSTPSSGLFSGGAGFVAGHNMSRRSSVASQHLLLNPSPSFGAQRLTPEQRRSEHRRTFSNDWPALGGGGLLGGGAATQRSGVGEKEKTM